MGQVYERFVESVDAIDNGAALLGLFAVANALPGLQTPSRHLFQIGLPIVMLPPGCELSQKSRGFAAKKGILTKLTPSYPTLPTLPTLRILPLNPTLCPAPYRTLPTQSPSVYSLGPVP